MVASHFMQENNSWYRNEGDRCLGHLLGLPCFLITELDTVQFRARPQELDPHPPVLVER